MNILGISAYYHDSSAALIVDGKIIAGSMEERFTRQKHDNRFPLHACRFCLTYANLTLNDIDAVVFYEKPFVKFERIIRTHIDYAPKGFKMFLKAIPLWLKERFNMRNTIKKELKREFGIAYNNIKFADHHLSHAANAYFQSGYGDSAILVVDAVGEDGTTSIYHAKDNQIKLIQKQVFPNSIGLLYSSFTYFLGFRVNCDEYKVMGLAPYGNIAAPETKKFISIIREQLVEIYDDGSIKLNNHYFSFMYSDRMVDDKLWTKIFEIERRKPGTELNQSHKNLALAIQTVTEEIVLKLTHTAKALTKSPNLCLSGGCAMNCVANGKILQTKEFDKVYISYSPDDSGGSIGAALAYYHINQNYKREDNDISYLGPEFTDEEILDTLHKHSLEYQRLEDTNLFDVVSKFLAEGKIVGWFQGRMEFGPRALGNRSILADARASNMKDRINSKIKFRESFRPFAPIIMKEHAKYVYPLIGGEAKHMSFTYNTKLTIYPAITHVDGTSRTQILAKQDNLKLYSLLESFNKLTGCPLLLNTSFNVMGEPIVCNPEDAVKTFLYCGLDIVVLNNFIITKK